MHDTSTLPLVRGQVKEILTNSPSFRSLPPDKRKKLAGDMVKVANYIVGGKDGDNIPSAAAIAANRSRSMAGTTAGEDFKEGGGAAAAQQGTDALGELVNKVDFPGFVGGLIDGVFNAIVQSSIQQMEAYSDLLSNVAKTVDEYMKDNVTENQARDYLADKYPDALEVDISGESPKIKPKEGADDSNMPDFFKDLGLPEPVSNIDEETTEQVLMPAARKRIAMDRQQLLATMVMMGMNRLVVTDGKIEASVLFELDTTDSVDKSSNRTTDFDYTRNRKNEWGGKGSRSKSSNWFSKRKKKSSWYTKNTDERTSNFKVSTVRDSDSESKVELHAKLAGKVNLNFKSDYFPLEKMTDVLVLDRIKEKAPMGNNQKQPEAAAAG